MKKFSLEIVEEIGPTKIKAYHLCFDGVNTVHSNIAEIVKEGTYNKEIFSLFSIIGQACNNKSLPEKKFKQLRNLGKVYEAKSKNLRMYMVNLPLPGHVIILLGKKTNQKRDLHRIKGLLGLLEDQGNIPINQSK